jgi:signal transduction histidine kinase
VPSLFYIRLISFTAGTLVYLFLLALILGHRTPRQLERLLFFVCLSLFMIYGGWLLEMNSILEYPRMPDTTRQFYLLLQYGGVAFLPGFLVHLHIAYLRTVSRFQIPAWAGWMAGIFYAGPILGCVAVGIYAASHGANFGFLDVIGGLGLFGGFLLLPALIASVGADFAIFRVAVDPADRHFFRYLAVCSALVFVSLTQTKIGYIVRSEDFHLGSISIVVLGILPGALLLYFAIRRNFLGFGAQRNLMYALPVTFLALLYLALVRRVSGWLEPVLPPEATAAVLLFSLIFLFEPLERVIGPALHRRFQEGLGEVQRLTMELQQEARQGSVAHLVAEAERRIREAFGLAVVRISIPRDAAAGALAAPGGLGHTASVRLIKDGEEIGVLEAASTGSYLTGETTAALGFLGEQLPGMIDLARLIEDKLRLERELAERERMASLGQMAANVSHNLRNPLSSMKTVLQVQLEDPDLPVNVRRDSTLVVGEIDRMSAKLTQLLRYAKPSVGGQRVAAVALANQTAVLFRHDADGRNVRFEFERPTHEIYALASEEALNEILSNLIVNALEAQTGGGRVRLSLGRYEGKLEIVVEDGGPGISPELRAKIFQPYFTTKPTGTGLGLSIVARRVEEVGGTISCESPVRNGKGTRFRLMLPTAEDQAGA